MGAGTYVSPTAIVVGDVQIGDNCYIGHGAILRGDYGTIVIGSGTAVEEGVVVHAPPDEVCRIGERVTIGHGAIVHSQEIEDLVVIGMGVVLGLRCRVGAGTIIAEGTVVKGRQQIPPGVVAVGNPARIARQVSEDDTQFWAWGKQLYVDLAARYLALGMQPVEPTKKK